MTQLEQILELWEQIQNTGGSAVMATVVKTQGSSYRLPGARLLITSEGRRAGSISGGCLEDNLVKKAWWLTEEGPVVRRYDTTPDGEIGPSFGLGCNGIIYVLLERVNPGNQSVLSLLREVRTYRRPAVIAHVLQPPELAGERLIIDTPGGEIRHSFEKREIAGELERRAKVALERVANETALTGTGLEVFFEVLTPPIQLLVFGAGDDAIPVVELAKFFGWRVSVVDGRAHYARRERFPQADDVMVRAAGDSSVFGGIDAWTAVVLMTHSYSQDLEAIRELAAKALTYLGVLGPRKRTVQLLADAGLDGASGGSTIHSPMGLDLGADGPEQVALSVIAEIQAKFNGRRGGLLRERAGSIHAADETATEWSPSIACAY